MSECNRLTIARGQSQLLIFKISSFSLFHCKVTISPDKPNTSSVLFHMTAACDLARELFQKQLTVCEVTTHTILLLY